MDDCVKRYKQRRDERLKARTECFHSDYGVKGMKWGEHKTQETQKESWPDRSKPWTGGDDAPFGPNDKEYQGRKHGVVSMYKKGEISQDVFGQLAMDNFSDDIVNLAVEREWITPKQADRIRGKYRRKKETSEEK